MNRCRIPLSFFTLLLSGIRTGKPKNRKVRLFLEKWQPNIVKGKPGKLFKDGLEIIPYERIDAVMKHEVENNGCPLSRDGAFAYLQKKFIGFKKRHVMNFLKRVEQLQMLHKRPFKNTRPNRQKKEGTTDTIMRGGNKWSLGVDLFDNPKEWTAYRYMYIAVLQKTGYTWLLPIKNKKAKTTLSALKKVLADSRKRFGVTITGHTSDDGSEFKNVYAAYLKRMGIPKKVVRLCWWVEKKNSTWARTFGTLRNIHGFKKALELTLLKINGTVNRVTKKAPSDYTEGDMLKPIRRQQRKLVEIPKLRKQPVYKIGTRVRFLLKYALGKSAFYKSYEGMRSKKHGMWSKRIFRIDDKKKSGYQHKYLVHSTWRPASELQEIPEGLVTLQGHTDTAPKKKPQKRKMSLTAPKKQVEKLRHLVAPVQRLRRSTRIRVKPQRYGYT